MKIIRLIILLCILIFSRNLYSAQQFSVHNGIEDKEALRCDSIELSEELFEKGMSLYHQQNYRKAIDEFKKVIYIDSLLYSRPVLFMLRSDLFNKDRRYYNQYANMWIASCEYKLGNDSIARKYHMGYFLPPYDRKLVQSSDSIFIKCNYELTPSNKDEYLKSLENAVQLDSLTFGKYSRRYFESLLSLHNSYLECNENRKSLKALLLAKDIAKSIIPHSSVMYANLLSSIGEVKSYLGEFNEAICYLEEYIRLAESNIVTKGDWLLNNGVRTLIDCYLVTKQPEKAFSMILLRLNYKKGIYNKTKTRSSLYDFIKTEELYANILYDAGYVKEALREYKYIESIQDNKNENTYFNIGKCYLSLNNIEEARISFVKARQLIAGWSDFVKKINSRNVQIESYLAETEFLDGNYKEAIKNLKIAINKVQPEGQETNSTYILAKYNKYYQLQSSLASCYNADKQYDKCIELETRNIQYKKVFFKPNSATIGISYLNLGEAFAGKKQFEKAFEYTYKAYELIKSRTDDLQRAMENLVKYSTELGQKKKAELYLENLYLIKKEQLLKYFAELTEYEKHLYWNKNEYFFTVFIPQYAYLLGTRTSCGILYNSILDTKGIILDSEKMLRKDIMESTNQKLKHEFSKIQEYKQILLNEYAKGERQEHHKIDSISDLVETLEDSLLIASKEYRKYVTWKGYNWTDIQSKLTTEEAAIEFITIAKNKNEEVYAAVLIKKKTPMPIIIELCRKDVIENLVQSPKRRNTTIDNLIWGPLLKYLREINCIYFSPSGILYNYGIEYAREIENKEIFRLSSTKELLKEYTTKKKSSGVLLVGGLNYNDTISKINTIYKNSHLHKFETQRAINNEELQNFNFKYLPYTKQEVYSIQQILKKTKNCHILTDNKGTEKAVRESLSQGHRIIHFATHGLYLGETNKNHYVHLPIVRSIDMGLNILSEDVTLSRSFILLTGCNVNFKNIEYLFQNDDGILTAQEIAQMDLRESDLVTLSACQTGLGKITNDGVFGLQRGFKKAGAKSLIMSLNNVSDKVTCEFMKAFYEDLYITKNIKRSFNNSVFKIKRKYPDKPEYWKSFVLMDAIQKFN